MMPSVEVAKKLADIFVVTMQTDSMNMIVTHHREKLINAIIYLADHTRYCGKTKLLKLLYFLDFSHFKQTGKSVTGLDYFAWQMGDRYQRSCLKSSPAI
jgi:hypothetical protein